MTDKPRGTTQRRGTTAEEESFKLVITYQDFAERVISGFGVIDKNHKELKEQIDKMMTIKHLKVKEMVTVTGLSYDLCRRFKQIAERYTPVDEVEK